MKARILAVPLLTLAATTIAQEPRRDIFRATATMVRVDVVVTGKDGRAVPDLGAEDFEIREDGKPQRIVQLRYVQLEPLPAARPRGPKAPAAPTLLKREQVRRTIALLVDDLALSFESTAYVRAALKKFVDEQMQPGDVAAIIRSSAGSGALQQFTGDKRLLAAAAERVRYSMMSRSGVSSYAAIADATSGNLAGENTLAEDEARLEQLRMDVFAVGTIGSLRLVLRSLDDLPGRKSVVLFSEGFRLFPNMDNTRAEAWLRSVVEQANRASVAIYTVDPRGMPTLSFAAADATAPEGVQDRRTTQMLDTQDPLVTFARETGGVFFAENNLSLGAARALEDQSGYYLIGYEPSASGDRPGRPHRIDTKVKRPGLTVRARSAYYEASDETPKPTPAPKTSAAALYRALTSPFSSGEVDVRLTSLFDHGKKQGSAMRTLLHIDGEDITYTKQPDGSSKAELEILAVTFGDKGEAIDQIATGSAIQVQADAEDAVRRSGVVYTVNVPVKQPGLYQLRAAVRDRTSGKVGSANQLVQVPDIKKGRLALSGLLLTGQAGAAQAREEGAAVDRDPQASEAVRRFRVGTAASYGFVVYNARTEKDRPQIESQIRVFREGQLVVEGKAKPVDPGPQMDMQRLIAGGALRFGPEMTPGDYVLQVNVTDTLAKKERTATQWIDFQIVP